MGVAIAPARMSADGDHTVGTLFRRVRAIFRCADEESYLTPEERLVLLAIAFYLNGYDDMPPDDEISNDTGFDLFEVERICIQLEHKGLVPKRPRPVVLWGRASS